MGLFSFFKKEENYEEILSSLEHDIRQAEKQRSLAIERMDWWAYNWLFYTGICWLAYLIGYILYIWPERHDSQSSGFLMHSTMVGVSPLLVYYGNMTIKTMCKRVINRHEARISRLREDLKERLDELKKKTAFDTTKNLIDRYSGGERNLAAEQQMEKGPKARLKQEAKNRRRTMPNFGTPGSLAKSNMAASPDTSLLAARSMQARTQQQQQQQQLLQKHQAMNSQGVNPSPQTAAMQSAPVVETGVVRVAPQGMPQPQANGAASRPWLDKLVNQLVGDVGSEHDKYALICRHCYGHNGLVLEEEIRSIQYTCPKCGKFNPSIQALYGKPEGSRQESEADGSQPAKEQQSRDLDDENISSGESEAEPYSKENEGDDNATDEGMPISTPVATPSRKLEAQSSRDSLNQSPKSPAAPKTKSTPRKRKGTSKAKRT
ncbi:hypothetical protein IWW42_002608 [Coemansia sp. RSA 1085]|nr:hypothetical protein LPJ68_000564 [Coemansia sp. RSA 1086]KAJ2672837.1 hypothetical protein IWW42_002608 [Coemansia sp. RSA 1085]